MANQALVGARSIAVATACLALMLMNHPGEAKAAPEATIRQSVEAEWDTPSRDGKKETFFRIRVRGTKTTGAEISTTAELTRYSCEERKGYIGCRPLIQREKVVSDDSLQMDASLESAALTFRMLGMSHHVEWVGQSERGRAASDGDCGQSPVGDMGEGVNRYAAAEGTVLGRKFLPGDSGPGSVTFMRMIVHLATC